MSRTINSNNITALRIAEARKNHKLTQGQLAVQLSAFINRDTPLTIPTISAWETGRQMPSEKMLRALAEFFDVSIGYLTGSEMVDGTEKIAGTSEEEVFNERQSIRKSGYTFQNMDAVTILETDLSRYDQRPVFITFRDYQHEGLWGILDSVKKVVLTLKGEYKLDFDTMVLYPLESYTFPSRRKRYATPISAGRFLKLQDKMWVEVRTPDQEIRNRYNGWYIHDKEHTAIIKQDNGLLLPYTGFAVSYDVYMEPYDIVIGETPMYKYPKKKEKDVIENDFRAQNAEG